MSGSGMPWFVFIIAACALVAWAAAMLSAVEIMRLAPRGTKVARYFDLGYWRFGKLMAELGPAAEPAIRRYRIAFIVFFAAVIGGILAAALLP